MQHIQKYCRARKIITDSELDYLVKKYHHRHPTFTIDLQERTCRIIIIACIYHYRHIEIDLRCEFIYNVQSQKFQSNWSSDSIQYKQMLDSILLHMNSSSKHRSLDDQIETIIEKITDYFIKFKPINEEEQSPIATRHSSISLSSSIEILQYEKSPQSQRKQSLERSFSCSQPILKQ